MQNIKCIIINQMMPCYFCYLYFSLLQGFHSCNSVNFTCKNNEINHLKKNCTPSMVNLSDKHILTFG